MLFLMENRQSPRGDYGDILWSGFAPWDEKTNRVYIERVGPFTPDIYIAGSNSLIFTKKAKDLYESSELLGVKFLYTAEKRKIVNIDWRKWDRKSIDTYINGIGEPEDIIDSNENDEILISKMPEYWIADASHRIHVLVNMQSSCKSPSEYLFINDNIVEGVDLFSGIEYWGYFVTHRFKQWVDKNFPECFDFFPAQLYNKRNE